MCKKQYDFKKDCAFYDEDRGEIRCNALGEMKCLGCRFYKTKEELKEGREKAAKKVAQLEPELQEHIRHKYYGGRRAFKNE